MKRKRLRRLSILAALMVMTTAHIHATPAIEAEPVTIARGRGKGIEVTV